MADIRKAGTFKLGDRTVKRLGYGAMQVAGKGVFGLPKDRDGALAMLREAIPAASNTSTLATFTARTLPIRSSAKHFTRMPTIS